MRKRTTLAALLILVINCRAQPTSPPSQGAVQPTSTASGPAQLSDRAKPTVEPSAPAPELPDTEQMVRVPLYPVFEGAHDIWPLGDAVLVQYGRSLGLLRDGKVLNRDDLSRQLHLHQTSQLIVHGRRWQASPEGTYKREGEVWKRLEPLQYKGKTLNVDRVIPGRAGELWAMSGDVVWHSEKPDGKIITLEYDSGQEH